MRPEFRLTPRPLLIVMIACTLCACADAPGQPFTGSARVTVHAAALSEADVADVLLRVMGPGIDPDIATVIERNADGAFVATIEAIPAGVARTFDATARDAGGAAIYAAAVEDIEVVSGQQAQVELLLQQVDAPLPWGNAVPAFTALVASASTVAPGQTVELRAEALDLDGDELGYLWTAQAGELSAPDSARTTWTAPAQPGAYLIDVVVRDSGGGSAAADLSIDVREPQGADDAGSALVSLGVNTAPEIAGLRADPGHLEAGATTLLYLEVSDPDGDALSRLWSADCDGVFSDEAGVARFTLEAPAPEGPCTLRVVVQDGRGGDNAATLTLPVGAPLDFEIPQALAVGGLVITEVMANPAALPDGEGEWFELFNATAVAVELQGCSLADASAASHTIADSTVVQPGGRAVLANGAAAAAQVDYVYAGIGLNNSDESLTLRCGGEVIDAVAWASSRAGVSTSLDPDAHDASSNDLPQAWCYATAAEPQPGGDRGTPGADNPDC